MNSNCPAKAGRAWYNQSKGTSINTKYINTDFDLKSKTAFDTLHRELDTECIALVYLQDDDGNWQSVIESIHGDHSTERKAEQDIHRIIEALNSLSDKAKSELAACYLREFNIGFECGDTWAYTHQLSSSTLRDIVEANCSVTVPSTPCKTRTAPPKVK